MMPADDQQVTLYHLPLLQDRMPALSYSPAYKTGRPDKRSCTIYILGAPSKIRKGKWLTSVLLPKSAVQPCKVSEAPDDLWLLVLVLWQVCLGANFV